MRFLSLILSIYVLYLLQVPCADNIDSCMEISTIAHSHTPSDAHHNHAHRCTPFCVCSCCHVNITLLQNIHMADPPVQTFTEMLCGYCEFQTEYVSTFWQPPKIA